MICSISGCWSCIHSHHYSAAQLRLWVTFLSSRFLGIYKRDEILSLQAIAYLFLIFSFPNRKNSFFCKCNFSGSTNGLNFKLCMGRACGVRSCTSIFLNFQFFKCEKFDFVINAIFQDLQKAWISNLACEQHLVEVIVYLFFILFLCTFQKNMHNYIFE